MLFLSTTTNFLSENALQWFITSIQMLLQMLTRRSRDIYDETRSSTLLREVVLLGLALFEVRIRLLWVDVRDSIVPSSN